MITAHIKHNMMARLAVTSWVQRLCLSFYGVLAIAVAATLLILVDWVAFFSGVLTVAAVVLFVGLVLRNPEILSEHDDDDQMVCDAFRWRNDMGVRLRNGMHGPGWYQGGVYLGDDCDD